eukprot:scaffold148_cov341-Pavlova_lutheri.AAC.56
MIVPRYSQLTNKPKRETQEGKGNPKGKGKPERETQEGKGNPKGKGKPQRERETPKGNPKGKPNPPKRTKGKTTKGTPEGVSSPEGGDPRGGGRQADGCPGPSRRAGWFV